MTFSIIARDGETGDFGLALESKFLAAAPRVMYAEAGVGAIATQADLNASFGPRGLALLKLGISPQEALAALTSNDPGAPSRQLAILAASGSPVAFTGDACIDWKGHILDKDFSCQGNMLVSGATLDAMAEAFTGQKTMSLPERLLASLDAGQAAGGDKRGQQSAGLLIVTTDKKHKGALDRAIDLRVDDHDHPIGELNRLLGLYRLHNDDPIQSGLIRFDSNLATELRLLVGKALGIERVVQSEENLWQDLHDWAYRENLEQRLLGRNLVDPVFLTALREAAADAGS